MQVASQWALVAAQACGLVPVCDALSQHRGAGTASPSTIHPSIHPAAHPSTHPQRWPRSRRCRAGAPPAARGAGGSGAGKCGPSRGPRRGPAGMVGVVQVRCRCVRSQVACNPGSHPGGIWAASGPRPASTAITPMGKPAQHGTAQHSGHSAPPGSPWSWSGTPRRGRPGPWRWVRSCIRGGLG